MISLYQRLFSPDHSRLGRAIKSSMGFGPVCRFYPTCSQYARDSIKKYGIFKGSLKAAFRVIRCNPLTKGGLDYP